MVWWRLYLNLHFIRIILSHTPYTTKHKPLKRTKTPKEKVDQEMIEDDYGKFFSVECPTMHYSLCMYVTEDQKEEKIQEKSKIFPFFLGDKVTHTQIIIGRWKWKGVKCSVINFVVIQIVKNDLNSITRKPIGKARHQKWWQYRPHYNYFQFRIK